MTVREKDCNSCRHHRQARPIPIGCQTCLEITCATFGEGTRLPFYEPKETLVCTPPELEGQVVRNELAAKQRPASTDAFLEMDPTHRPGAVVQMRVVKEAKVAPLLPTEAAARKNIPLASGVLDYFPAALIEIAKLSKIGNDQHNAGKPLHWSREKSYDHSDTILRHFMERGVVDTDGVRHSTKLAWRALALLQLELENAGAPKAPGAR